MKFLLCNQSKMNKEWLQLKRWWCGVYCVLMVIIAGCIGGIAAKVSKQNAINATVTSIDNPVKCGRECYLVTIEYTFIRNDTSYNITESLEFDSLKDAQTFIHQHENSNVTTYYEDDPSKATIDPTTSIQFLFTVIVGTILLLILVFIIACVAVWCERKELPDEVESPSIRDVLFKVN